MGKIQVNDPIRPRELTRLCAGETVDVALPEDVDNEGVLPVLGTGLATREEIVGPCFEALQRRLEAARDGERLGGRQKPWGLRVVSTKVEAKCRRPGGRWSGGQ
jgi:hypothetical protein